MRILLIHQAFMSPTEAGGTRHFELARELVADGYKVTIVAGRVSYLSGEKIRSTVTDDEVIDGVHIVRAYSPSNIHRSFVWRVFAFITFMISSTIAAMRSGRADVVMGTSPPIFQAASAWFVSAIRRRPFLFEVRDLWPEFAIEMGILRNPLLIRASRMLESFLLKRAHAILVNSPGFIPYLHSKGVLREKISLIPNGVDVTMFLDCSGREEMRETWGVGDSFVAVYAGAVGAANDIPVLLDAAEVLAGDNIQFVIAGGGKEYKNVEEDAGKRNLKNVRFVGMYPKSQMTAVLAAADCCIAILRDIPMFRTTYPNKVFDYMAAAKPVVLAIDGVIRSVVEEARCGIFSPPGDAHSLASKIRILAADRAATEEMGRRGRTFVTARFDRKVQANALRSLLERLYGEKSSIDRSGSSEANRVS